MWGEKETDIVMKKEQPLISVIVPVHNGQDYLENCIKSIEAQTYQKQGRMEIVIVNDGSTDATGSICDRLSAACDNVRVLTLHDEGVSVARNAGIAAAAGEFVTFVDADDRLLPETLQVLYDCMADTESDIAGCRFFLWSNEQEWQQACGGALSTSTADGVKTYAPDRYLKEAVLCGNSRRWSKLYRKDIVRQVFFQEKLTIGEDMLFLIRLLSFVDRIAETDYAGYGYFQNPAGTINRKFTPGYMDQITCWRLAREEVLRMAPELDNQVTALLIVGIMLTAGKLAMLSTPERRKNKAHVQTCHESLKAALQVSGAFGRLSAGYRLKAGLFLVWPGLYLNLYHLQKSVR